MSAMQATADEMKIAAYMKSRNIITNATRANIANREPRIRSAVFFFACFGVIYGLVDVGNGQSVDLKSSENPSTGPSNSGVILSI